MLDTPGAAVDPREGREPDYTLALEEARRSWDALNDELSALRTRTIQLVGIAGVAASVLGGIAATGARPLRWESGVGLVAFLTVVLLAFAVLWPRRLSTSIQPTVLVKWAELASPEQGVKNLALYLGEKYDANRKKINVLTTLFCTGLGATGVEVLALTGALARR
ncbi:hypothetical protein V3N99_22110 (plasmid) [Dermatophilaceae bacterium Soc4.6]